MGSAGSLYRMIPTMMEPAAPIPVHTAYAVPNGSERNASAINPKLSAIATSVATLGIFQTERPGDFKQAGAKKCDPCAHGSLGPGIRSPLLKAPADLSLRGSRDRDVTGEPPISRGYRPAVVNVLRCEMIPADLAAADGAAVKITAVNRR